MKKQKTILDEMQEQKLLQIEHNGFWLAFFGLLISIVIQIFMYGRDFERIAGEWCIFMCLGVYIVVSCLKNGIWDRRLRPAPGANLKASLTAGILSGIVFGFLRYREYRVLTGAAAWGVCIGILAFGVCFAGLSVLSFFYKWWVNRLENAEEEIVEKKAVREKKTVREKKAKKETVEIMAEKDMEENSRYGKERD